MIQINIAIINFCPHCFIRLNVYCVVNSLKLRKSNRISFALLYLICFNLFNLLYFVYILELYTKIIWIFALFFMCANGGLFFGDDNRGINFIIDLQNFSISRLKKFSPFNAKKLLFYLEDTFPIRINAVYIVGSKIISNLVYALNKPFLSQLLRSKIEFVNLTALHQVYSTEILTRELGGKLAEMNSDAWYLELVRAESLTSAFLDKFYVFNSTNLSKSNDLSDDIDSSDNNLLDSQNSCNTNGHPNLPSFLQILPSCSDYFIPTPVYK